MQIRFTMHWNNFTRSSGNAPLLWERMKSRQPFVSFHSEWHLTVFLTTVIDPSLSLRMTPYHLPHYGSKFFAGAHTRTLNVSRHSDSFLQSSFWMDARMLCEKDRKRDSDTEWRIYYLEWHLTVFLTTIIDPSLSLQDDAFRSPSLWRFPFPITSDALSFNRHSERRQKCCSRKTGNGIVTQSEESITLNDILRFSSPR